MAVESGHILHSGRDGAGGDQDVPHRPRPLPQVRRGHDQPRPGDRAALLELLENRLQVEDLVTLPAPMIVEGAYESVPVIFSVY